MISLCTYIYIYAYIYICLCLCVTMIKHIFLLGGVTTHGGSHHHVTSQYSHYTRGPHLRDAAAGLKKHRETARRPQPPSLSEVEVRAEARKSPSWKANTEEEVGTSRVANSQLKCQN